MAEKTFTYDTYINIGRMDFQNVLILACRHALAKQDYAITLTFTEFAEPLIPMLKMKTLSVLFRDIHTHLGNNTDFCTERGMWESFCDSLAVQISSRGCRFNPMYGGWEAID